MKIEKKIFDKKLSANDESRIRGRWVDVWGVQTYYRIAGKQGIPVLLIHGGGSDHSAFSWKYALEALAEHHRVIALDLPGYGNSQTPWQAVAGDEIALRRTRSQSPKYDPEDVSTLLRTGKKLNPFRFHIHFIEAFLDTLNLSKIHLIGISMGGGIALGFALNYPDRILRLILVDSYGFGGRMGNRWLALLTYVATRTPFLNFGLRFILNRSRYLVKLGLENLFHNPAALTEELIDDAWKAIKKAGMHPAWRAFLVNEIDPLGFHTSYHKELPDLSSPTLILHGENDTLFPAASAKAAADLIPQSDLHIFPDCGHIPPLEKPGEFEDIVLQYLNETRPNK